MSEQNLHQHSAPDQVPSPSIYEIPPEFPGIKKPTLKLFIWTNFNPVCTVGLAFAIAENEAQAREMVTKEMGHEIYDWGELEIRNIDVPVARCVYGGG